jgi:hypothetical protein
MAEVTHQIGGIFRRRAAEIERECGDVDATELLADRIVPTPVMNVYETDDSAIGIDFNSMLRSSNEDLVVSGDGLNEMQVNDVSVGSDQTVTLNRRYLHRVVEFIHDCSPDERQPSEGWQEHAESDADHGQHD